MIRRTDLTANELVEILNANPTGKNQYTGKGGSGKKVKKRASFKLTRRGGMSREEKSMWKRNLTAKPDLSWKGSLRPGIQQKPEKSAYQRQIDEGIVKTYRLF